MFDYCDVLPSIVTAYHEGALVPFIGSGMSIGACVGWPTMLDQLAVQLGREADGANKDASSENLYRVADNLTALIEPRPISERANIYRCAMSVDQPMIPQQTKALASVFWPLVISTNYDDVYWSAINGRFPKPSILGRSREDCHQVLTSLDACVDPILWSIQGFVGGPFECPSLPVPEEYKRERLVEQVVVGHRQYQRATSDASHFRRAFAEVYRRRSLWFLGSGITESYLISLLSEIRHYYGAARHQHFACLRKDTLDEKTQSFLQSRLGILPITYSSHECLPNLLETFANEARKLPSSLIANKYRVTGKSSAVDVEIVASPLPDCPDEAIIVSVGRNERDQPIEGAMAKTATEYVHKRRGVSSLKWCSVDKENPPSVFRYGDSRLFAVAARVRYRNQDDIRDLGVIPNVVQLALKQAAEESKVLHVGAVASGPKRLWHPIYPFVQTLLAVKRFVASESVGRATRIVLHAVDWRVWMAFRANLVSVPEILFSDVVRYRVEICSDRGMIDTFTMASKDVATVESILDNCELGTEGWEVEMIPRPSKAMNLELGTKVPPSTVIRIRAREGR